jgi:hypothetical protein
MPVEDVCSLITGGERQLQCHGARLPARVKAASAWYGTQGSRTRAYRNVDDEEAGVNMTDRWSRSNPRSDAAENQDNQDVRLYAHVRAETARAIGSEADARKWERVEAAASECNEDCSEA